MVGGRQKRSLGKVVKTHSAINVGFSLTAFSGQKGGDLSRCQTRVLTKNFRLEMTAFFVRNDAELSKGAGGKILQCLGTETNERLTFENVRFSFKPTPNLPKDIAERNLFIIFSSRGFEMALFFAYCQGENNTASLMDLEN